MISGIPAAEYLVVNIDIDSVFTRGMTALLRVRPFKAALPELPHLEPDASTTIVASAPEIDATPNPDAPAGHPDSSP